MKFSSYLPIAKSISVLFHPYVEVLIHDIKTDKVAAIFNSFSGRKVGDPSLLCTFELDPNQLNQPYLKTNADSRPLKSISTILVDPKGVQIGLMCINFDISVFKDLQNHLSFFLDSVGDQPQALFKNDWQDRIHLFVSQYIQKNHLDFKTLSKWHKKKMIQELFNNGAFNSTGAAKYVADNIQISRATVYKYLNECKKNEFNESN